MKNFPPPRPSGQSLSAWMQRNNQAGWFLTQQRKKERNQPPQTAPPSASVRPPARAEVKRGPRGSGWRPSTLTHAQEPVEVSAADVPLSTGKPRRRGTAWRVLASIPVGLVAVITGLLLLTALSPGRLRVDYPSVGLIFFGAIFALVAIWRRRGVSAGAGRGLLTGEVRGFTARSEPLGSDQNGTQTVWAFRLEYYEDGVRQPPFEIEMHGQRFRGTINDGDHVTVYPRSLQGRSARADRVYNQMTGSYVIATRTNNVALRIVGVLVLLAFIIIFGVLTLAVLASRAAGLAIIPGLVTGALIVWAASLLRRDH